MDDRKKQIGELERQKKDQAVALELQLSHLGETFFGRIVNSPPEDISAFGELDNYRRLQGEIEALETSIRTVEDQIRRSRELEEGIETREQEEGAFIREITAMNGSLGKFLLGASESGTEYAEFCLPYREQAEALTAKVDSLDERLAALEQNEKNNVFTWIGVSAQSLVLRSFLTRAQENLEQLRRNVGDRYSRLDSGRLSQENVQSGNSGETAEIDRLCTEIEQKREELRALSQDLETLREEKRKISGSFNAEGGPLKQINNLKKRITVIQDEMKVLYRRVGAELASISGGAEDVNTERRQILDAFIYPEDREVLDNLARIGETIRDAETAIEKLKASLAIDAEKAKIEKYRRMIQDKKDRIVQAEKSIAEFEASILNSEASIEKLQDLL